MNGIDSRGGGKTWPKLYKKSSTGAILEWSISTIPSSDHSTGYDLHTRHGQVDGKIQEGFDSIYEGKNVGKKNETTPEQQSASEAQSKWEKQKKKGYVETIEDAQGGKLDALIEGGIVPMLAHKFSEQGHKIKYPAFVQPKLDGIRCIAIVKNGKCTLWSRTRKQITGVPHIVHAIESVYGHNEGLILDGELYNHAFKSNFEKIVSFVRQETPIPGHEVVQYHVYDIPNANTFADRAIKMRYFKTSAFIKNHEIQKVDTVEVADEDEAISWFETWRMGGYEGAMIRNADGLYVNKRSYDLQKIKEFDDAEFKIVEVEEGRGKLAGCAIFVCETKEGKTFNAKLKGDTEALKEYFVNKQKYIGNVLTVKYQGLTGYGIPRFPVGVAIRDYE